MKASVDFSRNVVSLMGLPFDAVTMQQAVDSVRAAAQQRRRLLVSTANLNFVVAARSDEMFRDSVVHSQLCLADGMPIVWVSRLLGLPVRERVSGAGLFEALCATTAEPTIKVFFFGGPDGVAQTACERINRCHGGVECVGFESPGFVSVEAMSGEELIQRINRARPDFVVVSLGAKKGQAWIERNRARLDAPVISHLGAVVNIAAGAVRRSPRWLQLAGLEWLWRVKEEPGLWRRYARDAFAFARILVAEVLPLWWRRGERGGQDAVPPTIDCTLSASGFAIRLAGVFRGDSGEGLRSAFADAVATSRDIGVDLSDVEHIDATAAALLLLLSGHQRDAGRRLDLRGASPVLRRQFRYHHIDALLDGAYSPPGQPGGLS
jgi:N-acetylglucosaminyldiphosphoundecaprenol N-acetyl-beta-D-mannosaminyltransferase